MLKTTSQSPFKGVYEVGTCNQSHRFTRGVLFNESLVAEFCIPNRNKSGSAVVNRCYCFSDFVVHGWLSIGESGDCESCRVFTL